MSSDEKYDFALANMIIGLKRYNEKIIDKIYVMYDGIDEETLIKIKSIWTEAIELIRYSDENFSRDVSEIKREFFFLLEEYMRMYSKLVYAKFYVLDFLAKSSDKSSAIVLMDTDALVLDSFEDLTKLDVDYSARVSLYNEINVRKYFDKKGISVDLRENPKCNGGFYYFNKKVLRNKDLNTKKML